MSGLVLITMAGGDLGACGNASSLFNIDAMASA